MSSIEVSIIVAVYNRETLLDRCIDSLVYQTFELPYEILLVDDYSTDASWEIMESWYQRFPDKIRLLKSDSKGVAYAKNTGIRAAKGRYLTFVDSDDYVDYRMLRRLYEQAVENDYPEMVYSPIYRVSGKKKTKIATLASHETIEDYLKGDAFYLVGKLIRSDLFERFGCLPHFSQGEDLCWLIPAMSYLETIVYFALPSYYYEFSSNSICLDVENPQLIEDILTGSQLIIEKANPVYREHVIIRAMTRMANFSHSRPLYKDVFYRFIHDNIDLLNNIDELETKSSYIENIRDEISNYYTEIPQTIYLNGFGETDIAAQQQKVQRALREEPRVVVLSAENCDVDQCPVAVAEAYAAGNTDFVGKYFALKACYEQGGIYIDEAVEIEAPFNVLLNDPSFFAFESKEVLSDKVFGSCPGNPFVQKLLQTYDHPELFGDSSLSDRLKTVLAGGYNVQIVSCNMRKLEYGFCLYPVEMFVSLLPGTLYPHVAHYQTWAGVQDEVLEIPESILTALYQRHVSVETGKLNVGAIRRDRDWLKMKLDSSVDNRDWLQKRLDSSMEVRDWLQKKLDSSMEVRDWLQKKLDSTTENRDWLQKKLDYSVKQRNQLQQDCSKQKAELRQLDKDRQWLKKQNTQLQSELDEYKNSFFCRVGLKCHRLLRKIKHVFIKG